MSTSDQQEHGPLTRKQLREIRLTGSTPVISAEEAAAAAAAPAAPPVPPPVPPLPRAAEPAEIAPAPGDDVDSSGAPLTRRQIREQERVKTASVPVLGGDESASAAEESAPQAPAEEPIEEDVEEEAAATDVSPAESEEIVSGVPAFAPPSSAFSEDEDEDDDDDEQVDVAPVSAAAAVDTVGDVPLSESTAPVEIDPAHVDDDPVAAVAALGIEVQEPQDTEHDDTDDVLADVKRLDDADLPEGERPVVSEAFGYGVLADAAEPQQSFTPSFDELLSADSSGGSQHTASNTLIFNPPAGEGSLDGPVASTGEILVTGSYELPQGIGSQGHAHGVADGKDVDSVLIDGELPPASSPTPIAASAAISTIKPAGEVIRPPAPEKGNKLMLTLAIVAGGLALALGVVLIVAFTTKLI
ncbi:hypothetical protein QFZ53_002879 [Microbacterium natoriense]|uniref:Uncharacterized protein n=1 Tax=Microbacterium natoriense TaxID=284570 RepID=A0AAW8EZL1_9MICO|nr:hypothetical protein [Microbacterium natoriense]MDQ0648683.1 hypothetical protein [Microbacterium natoriense]